MNYAKPHFERPEQNNDVSDGPIEPFHYSIGDDGVLPAGLTIKQFCRFVGIGRTTAYKLKNLNMITTFKVGRRTLVTRSSAESLIKRGIAAGSA